MVVPCGKRLTKDRPRDRACVRFKAFFRGEGNTLISAVDARSFLRRNGHGLRPPSVAASAQGCFLPPVPPILPPTRFFRRTGAYGKSPSECTRFICLMFIPRHTHPAMTLKIKYFVYYKNIYFPCHTAVRGCWGGWGSLRGNYGNAFPRFAAERLGPFLPRAATQRAAAGRVRQATQEPYGHRQQSKGAYCRAACSAARAAGGRCRPVQRRNWASP